MMFSVCIWIIVGPLRIHMSPVEQRMNRVSLQTQWCTAACRFLSVSWMLQQDTVCSSASVCCHCSCSSQSQFSSTQQRPAANDNTRADCSSHTAENQKSMSEITWIHEYRLSSVGLLQRRISMAACDGDDGGRGTYRGPALWWSAASDLQDIRRWRAGRWRPLALLPRPAASGCPERRRPAVWSCWRLECGRPAPPRKSYKQNNCHPLSLLDLIDTQINQ